MQGEMREQVRKPAAPCVDMIRRLIHMKKNWLALLLFVLSMMMVLNTLPMSAMAEADDEWICSDCHIWVCVAYCPQCEKTRPTLPADGECLLTLDREELELLT